MEFIKDPLNSGKPWIPAVLFARREAVKEAIARAYAGQLRNHGFAQVPAELSEFILEFIIFLDNTILISILISER